MTLYWNKITVIGAFFALITVFSCNNNEIKQTVIKANIVGAANQQVFIENTNPLKLYADTSIFDENGVVNFIVDIKSPSYFNLTIGKSKMILYVRPGDSVIVSANASNILSSALFSGDAPIYNDYLIRFNNISMGYQKQIMKEFSKREEVVIKSIDSVRALHADELAALQKGNSNIDPYFLKIEKARMLYEWAILHRIYPDYHNYIYKESKFVPSPEYDTYLAEVNFDDGEIIGLPLYVSFLETYMRSEYNTYFTDSLMDRYPSFVNYQLEKIAKKFKNKEVKEVMAYNAVKQQVTYDGIKDFDTYWDKFTRMCDNKNLIADINNRLAKWEHLQKGKPAKDFSFVDMQGQNVSLSDFKGKWIYIDIWASWCSPCMNEVPYLKALEEEFSDGDIVFMSISVDRTQDPWRKTVVTKDMKGVQLWAGQNDIIKDFYKVSGIPRFMIIDPNGNIYAASAERPSNGVAKELKKLLNDKAS